MWRLSKGAQLTAWKKSLRLQNTPALSNGRASKRARCLNFSRSISIKSNHSSFINSRTAFNIKAWKPVARLLTSRNIGTDSGAMSQQSTNGGPQAQRSIQLTELEEKLRRLLLDVASFIDQEKPSQLRFTGGWVRDKLLGTGSKDIDVGIDNMTGYAFGLKMAEYLEVPGNSEKYGLMNSTADGGSSTEKEKVVGGLHKIEANPEKSKHLETVTTKVFGLDIDLVNLRKETYTEDSRNPQMEFGTPEEDALRRDATINAMFYNLQTNKVEDFTSMGLKDLENGIIRTPLEPYQTFKDDPLRVLRLIRFASRLQYQIDPAAEESMKDEPIREALRVKISRERIGVELEKMLYGTQDKNARLSLDMIDSVGLYNTIFTDPTVKMDYKPETSCFRPSFNCVYEVCNSREHLHKSIAPNKESQYIFWLLSTFVPFADAPSPPPPKGKKKAPALACNIAREGIKAPNKVSDIVEASVVNLEDIISVKNRCYKKLNGQNSPELLDADQRDTLGMAIRRWGPSWHLQVAFAMMVESARVSDSGVDVFRSYEIFFKHVESLELFDACSFKSVVDGKTLAAALDTKPGPWMKDALDVVMAWQLRNPENADKDGAIKAVKEKHGELTISLLKHFLQLTLRPLFSKMQTHNVTPAGHKRTVGQAKSFELDEGLEKRPWKKEANAFALSLLTWVLRALTPKLTGEYWNLLIPPVFALLDDMDTQFKARGCDMTCLLLNQTPPALLKRTGLGKVFEDAISPCLTYLPGLTPEQESLMLLNSAFPAIFKLYAVQFPGSVDGAGDNSRLRISAEHVKALSSVLQETIIPSIEHMSDRHPQIVTVLLQQMGTVVEILGIQSVAHLKDTLSVLATIMTDPYATGDLEMLEVCVNTQQVVIANAWPRAYFWRSEILKGLCTAWLRVCEDEYDFSSHTYRSNSGMQETKERSLTKIKEHLSKTGKYLVAAIDATKSTANDPDSSLMDSAEILAVDLEADFRLVVGEDRQLEQLRVSMFGK